MSLAFYRRALTAIGVLTMLTAHAAAVPLAPPEILLTWTSDSYVPPTYGGALLPTQGGVIMVAAQLLDNHKLTTAPDAEFRWYVNDNLVASGNGMTALRFNTKDFASGGEGYTVEVLVRGYAQSGIRSDIRIPLAQPQLVITTPYPGRAVFNDGTLVTALPYYFSINSLADLSFGWEVRGLPQATDDNTLLLINQKQAAGELLPIAVTARTDDGTMQVRATVQSPLY